MTFRIVRLIVLAIVAIAAAISVLKGVGLLRSGDGGNLVLPVGLIISGPAILGGFLYAFSQSSLFRGFRTIIGVVSGIVIYWMLADSVVAMLTAKSTAHFTQPVALLAAAVAVAAIFYFSFIGQTSVRRVLENMFSIPELMKKLAFTLALLCIYRMGFHIPLPGLDQAALSSVMSQQKEGPWGQALDYFAMFTGGNLQQSTLFGLGIMPYISSSIIFTLLATVLPSLERLRKEGPAGYKKIQEYTRYLAVVLCVVQAVVWMRFMMNPQNPMVYKDYVGSIGIFLMGVLGLTTGTMFLMWLGEQIDEYGIGNGISLIIMAGIVVRLPWAIRDLGNMTRFRVTGADQAEVGLVKIVFLIASFLFVVSGSILISQAQRRIPIQQAKQTRGRRVYGGQRQYLPLRVNHGGVMPIIFASSLLIFPNAVGRYLAETWHNSFTMFLAKAFQFGDLMHELVYVALIFFFAYFWTTVQFRPKDMSEQLQDYGSFIPGLRPGKRTEEYLEKVMERITYCGAGFLAVIAVIPQVIATWMGIPWNIAAFLGGTGLLITVSVALDLVQRVESNLVMHNYSGFLGEGRTIKGPNG